MRRDGPIGIFDSGVGGLTVLRQVIQLLPCEDIVYFGDTARVPYGNKSKPTVVKFSRQSLQFLIKKKVKMVVVACNTSSSLALGYLQKTFDIPVLGVIEAGAKKALDVSKRGKIGIIGTRSTIASKSYLRAIQKKTSRARVYSCACPLFVPLVEEGIIGGPIVRQVTEMYLRPLKKKGIDTIILGCTHYPLLEKEIASYLGNTYVVDSAREVARHAKEMLAEYNLLTPKTKKGQLRFYVSDEPKGFSKLARLFLKKAIPVPRVTYV